MNKPRLILVPQLPVRMRYTEWWINELPNNLSQHFSEIISLGDEYLLYFTERNSEKGLFSAKEAAIEFETSQITEFMNLELKDDDILLLCDISYPGLFSNILYHKRPKKCYAICHGTSRNKLDIFEKDRESKWQVESGHAELFDKIFVGSEYHKGKLGWHGVKVIGMPNPPMTYDCDKNKKKTIDILSVSRNTEQKVDSRLEKLIEEKYGKIHRESYSNWSDYFNALSSAKILFISANEETYGYQIIDCLKYGNGCIPLAPDQFSYPEMLTEYYLYKRYDINEIFRKIDLVLNGGMNVPVCKNGDLFYEKLVKEIL